MRAGYRIHTVSTSDYSIQKMGFFFLFFFNFYFVYFFYFVMYLFYLFYFYYLFFYFSIIFFKLFFIRVFGYVLMFSRKVTVQPGFEHGLYVRNHDCYTTKLKILFTMAEKSLAIITQTTYFPPSCFHRRRNCFAWPA